MDLLNTLQKVYKMYTIRVCKVMVTITLKYNKSNKNN